MRKIGTAAQSHGHNEWTASAISSAEMRGSGAIWREDLPGQVAGF
jgi:hypothetical protein